MRRVKANRRKSPLKLAGARHGGDGETRGERQKFISPDRHDPTVAPIARKAGDPVFNITGNRIAATTAPGRASSIRRRRAVSGTWPISQKPPTRIR
jgi:hypothetical protein